ncbi:MAG: carbon storage regulator [Fimbriiglobus sp.]|jgi:carbon storage regulator|nr:carbon storage regulator [Fimbriiglobus sp.]
MLIISRKVNETLLLDQELRVTVVQILHDKVRLGVTVPRHVPVYREELFEAIQGREFAPPSPPPPPPPPAPATAPIGYFAQVRSSDGVSADVAVKHLDAVRAALDAALRDGVQITVSPTA